MPVPAKRRSRSKARRGRAHLSLKKVTLNDCPKCGRAVKPHTACAFCGSYKDRTVIKIKEKTAKAKKEV